MVERGIARLFRNGRSQAVRLPREFRFPGDRVRVRRVGRGVVLTEREASESRRGALRSLAACIVMGSPLDAESA